MRYCVSDKTNDMCTFIQDKTLIVLHIKNHICKLCQLIPNVFTLPGIMIIHVFYIFW